MKSGYVVSGHGKKWKWELTSGDGLVVVTGPEFEKEDEAWQAAFELYRRTLVV